MNTQNGTYSNVQLELLKLYSTDLSENELAELKGLLGKFYADKSIELADQEWQNKQLTNDKMDDWLNNG